MVKQLYVFLLSFLWTTNVFAGLGGYIGTADNRSYGRLSDSEYRGVVKLSIGNGRCTGGFISKNLIITNDHCALHCIGNQKCTAEYWNGSGYETSNVRAVLYYKGHQTFNGTDWAILLSDKNSNFYKSVSPTTTPGQVSRGGYGVLRVIEDDEVPMLKAVYKEVMIQMKQKCADEVKKTKKSFVECINREVDKRLEQSGQKPLFKDSDNFKVQQCNILGDYDSNSKIARTDCDSSGGDSGAPLLRNNQIMGLNSGGNQNLFGDSDVNAIGIKTENFYDYAKQQIQKYQNMNTYKINSLSSETDGRINTNKNTNNITDDNVYDATSQKQTEPVELNPDDENYKIEQILQQRLQDFDCD